MSSINDQQLSEQRGATVVQGEQGAGSGGMQQPMQQQYPPQGAGYGMYPGYGGPWMRPRRHYPIETKPFFLTSEFGVFALATIALAITAGVDQTLDARYFWLIECILAGLYMLSRGVAKAGTKSRSFDPREDLLPRDSGHDTT